MKKIGIIILIIVVALVIFFLTQNEENPVSHEQPGISQVSNFEECAAAGNPVMESYPRQCRSGEQTFIEETEPQFSHQDALEIAQANQECSKVGVLTNRIVFNETTQTWWIDLERMPELEKDGCNPACVVSQLNRTVEVNWRCASLTPPDISAQSDILKLFVGKYPKYSRTLSVNIGLETKDHARGDVIFEAGAPGGLFLAAKVDDQWQIVFDGNGQIDCDLLEPYNFPVLMTYDCAESSDTQPSPASFCTDECGNGICQEIVCMAVGCPCAETQENCPNDCD